MTLTLSEANEIANLELQSRGPNGDDIRIITEKTGEYDVGWVFYYQSARFLETGTFSDTLVGNAPLFVARLDGKAFFVSYHRSIIESIAAYRACGNPNACEVPEVKITGWRSGAIAVSAIQLIRQHSTLGLGQAKRIIDDCLDNQSPVVSVAGLSEARLLVQMLASVGFESEVCYGG